MATSKVRAHFEILKKIAQDFGTQAQNISQTQQQLGQQMEVLRGGDWLGESANKFYAEMDSKVLPSIKRLAKTLEEAQQVTQKISEIMHRTEETSAAIFKFGNIGLATGAGAAAGGAAESGASASGGPGGGAAGGAAGGTSAGPGGGSGSAGGAAGGAAPGGAATPTTRMLSKFDSKVAGLVGKSPTLAAQLDKLEKAGWTIKNDPTSTGYYTDHTNKVIVINGGTPEVVTGKIAHEVGHADDGNPFIAPTASMTRAQFVQGNVDSAMKSEGVAQLNAATSRDEIRKAGGTDPGIPGTQTAAYQKVYDDYKAGTITRDVAVTKMSDLMNNEGASTTGKKYRDNYATEYGKYWDANVAPGRKVP